MSCGLFNLASSVASPIEYDTTGQGRGLRAQLQMLKFVQNIRGANQIHIINTNITIKIDEGRVIISIGLDIDIF